ncbi:hypothetical protein DEU56DRAFT_916832 [Suillus clintonianus]|uniref:uncharacterized protein n=1 Tax=Suillus clintonianus TaxID=1904413 RepID=UPI001B87BDAA|nr:uncharacterized protein DEU56DRAFT_916832 [Suillus clintonianus]KAG2124892.1 hypothetical protein DEU56DRAFT_916832 [Suillus clintonianus]
MDRYAGIVYRSLDQRLLQLSLQEVDVRVWMVDVSARVILSQVFENKSESPTSRATYVFPLPAGAATCAFELEHAGGRKVITGVVKEKSEAAKSLCGAVYAGNTERLVEWVTDNIFTISVGSIPARQKLTARLTFVMDLFDEGRQDHIYLRLPMAIAERCGETPAAVLDASTTNEMKRVQITVDIRTSDAIQDIRSPSHQISLQRHKTCTDRTDSDRRMTATRLSTTFLDRDFELTVHALGLGEPRCFAEVNPQRDDTIAMRLSSVPKFEMPRVASQEYIFIIDRSSSMRGASLETAKRTLEMLLHLLPDSNTTFNIFSFAGEVDSMWETSVSFNEATMQDGISHIKAMQANHGGTKIAQALQLAVASRNRDRPTAMFVLTGGDIHVEMNSHQRKGMFARCRRVVKQVLSRAKNSSTYLDPFEIASTAVKSCRPNTPLRIFTLGIGEHVSSAICERLAREGGGECLFVVQAEDMIEKCARLLNAGRTRVIESIVVDWHGSGNPPRASHSNHNHLLPPGVVQLKPPPQTQQVPHSITRVCPGVPLSVFAIITSRSIPREVRLRAKVEGVAEVLELVVPVTARFKDERQSIPLLHTLAAGQLIKHLAKGRAPLPTHMTPASNEEVRKAAIVRLGLEYQLVSQHTSFFAVESRREAARSGLRRSTSQEMSLRQRYYASPPSVTSDASEEYALGTDMTTVQTALANLSEVVCAVFSIFSSGAALTHQRLLPDTYYPTTQPRSSSPSSQSTRPFRHDKDNSSTDSFSTLSSLDGSSTYSRWTNSWSAIPLRPAEDPIQRIRSLAFDPSRNARLRIPLRVTGRAVRPQPHTSGSRSLLVPKDIYTLILLQRYDGSFTPSPELAALVGVEMPGRAEDFQADGNIWATAVVVAYLRYHLDGQPNLLRVLLRKPLEYGERKGNGLLVGQKFSNFAVIARCFVG